MRLLLEDRVGAGPRLSCCKTIAQAVCRKALQLVPRESKDLGRQRVFVEEIREEQRRVVRSEHDRNAGSHSCRSGCSVSLATAPVHTLLDGQTSRECRALRSSSSSSGSSIGRMPCQCVRHRSRSPARHSPDRRLRRHGRSAASPRAGLLGRECRTSCGSALLIAADADCHHA